MRSEAGYFKLGTGLAVSFCSGAVHPAFPWAEGAVGEVLFGGGYPLMKLFFGQQKVGGLNWHINHLLSVYQKTKAKHCSVTSETTPEIFLDASQERSSCIYRGACEWYKAAENISWDSSLTLFQSSSAILLLYHSWLSILISLVYQH